MMIISNDDYFPIKKNPYLTITHYPLLEYY